MLIVLRNFIVISCVPLLFLFRLASAETLRVTTWNLQGATSLPANGILTNSIEAAATALKQLDPDVILLQKVRDWRMCSQLAQSLKPVVYEVLICSAFPETSGTGKENRQAAILSKRKGYFSWSEAWTASEHDKKLSGGTVFAAIQTADHRVGLFSVELDGANPEKVQPQWTQQIQSIRKWITNRPESVVLAAGLMTQPDKIQIVDKERVARTMVTAPVAAIPLQTGERISSRLVTNPDAFPALVLSRFPQTCDLDLELAQPTPVLPQVTESETKRVETKASPSSEQIQKPSVSLPADSDSDLAGTDVVEPTRSHTQIMWLALTPLAIGSLGVLIWVLARQGNNPRREVHLNFQLEAGTTANSDSVLVTSPSTTGSTSEESVPPSISQPVIQQLQVWQQRALAAERKAQQANDVLRAGLMSCMREWLKQKLFRKLMADRAQLLESHHLATLKALAVDERLSKLEVQIQQQNHLYEQRIEKLTQELAVTKEESRALIRAQIVQIKSEMEGARARLIAEAARNAVTS